MDSQCDLYSRLSTHLDGVGSVKKIMVLASLTLLAGCGGLTLERLELILGCSAYSTAYIGDIVGVSGARAFLDIVDDSLPEGKCAVAESILEQRAKRIE